MASEIDNLRTRSLIVIFTYAPAGFGHLRVTEALYHGLPPGVPHFLLGSHDASISYLHRLASVHPLGNKVMEWLQRGMVEDEFTAFYRWFLRRNTQTLYDQITTILEQRLELPKILLVVATHFGLAHQLAAIKNRLEKEKNLKVILVVQVTDDSPGHLWYIAGADLIVVPSNTTRNNLLAYGRKFHLGEVSFAVLPYPISPSLRESLSDEKYQQRMSQVEVQGDASLHIMLPISGAAVGLAYFTTLMTLLLHRSKRFIFHIVVKKTPYTQTFINKWLGRSSIRLTVVASDIEVVRRYEDIYENNLISLEITKPSEQAFKILLKPKQRGGALILFSEPVGQQEKDNLDFLKRHMLIPSENEQSLLWRLSVRGNTLEQEEATRLRVDSATWRGLRLPDDPTNAADFIVWCLREGIFENMMRCEVHPHPDDSHAHELGDNGVEQFWSVVARLLS